MSELTRPLPAAHDMERGVLSCMMQAPDRAIATAQSILKAEHFHLPGHRILFDLMKEFHIEGTPVEPVSLHGALKDRNQLGKTGDMAWLVEIYTFAAATNLTTHYAEQVRDKATLRKIIATCSQGIAAAFDNQEDVKGTLSSVENSIMGIREVEELSGMTLSGKEALFKTLDAIEAQIANQEPDGVPWGLPQLDASTGGICPGLLLVGAETSGGKSILAMMAVIALLRAGKSVEYYSLEMPIDLCVRRMLCFMSRLNFKRIRNPIPEFSSGEHSDFQKAVREFGDFADRLTICADSGKTATGILSDIRQKMATKKTDAVVVDYIQRLTPEDSKATSEQQISDASRVLKRMADQFNIPVITPVQLNDAGLVRGSRMLGMDADTYIRIIHKKDKEGQPDEPDEHGRRFCGLWIEKNRNGERWFLINALMDGAKMSFIEDPPKQ